MQFNRKSCPIGSLVKYSKPGQPKIHKMGLVVSLVPHHTMVGVELLVLYAEFDYGSQLRTDFEHDVLWLHEDKPPQILFEPLTTGFNETPNRY